MRDLACIRLKSSGNAEDDGVADVGLDSKEVMKHQDETALTRDVATAWNPDHVKI